MDITSQRRSDNFEDRGDGWNPGTTIDETTIQAAAPMNRILVDPPVDDEEAKVVLTTAYEELFGSENLFAIGIAQAIGLQEGHYGKWEAKNNWGAITRAPNSDGSCPADSVLHGDSSFEQGDYYVTCFRTWPTSLDGAKGFLEELYVKRPNTHAAAQSGDIRGVARDMYETNYYLGTAPPDKRDSNGDFTNVNNYIDFIGRGVDQISPLYPSGSTPSNTGRNIAIAAGIGAVLIAAAVMR